MHRPCLLLTLLLAASCTSSHEVDTPQEFFEQSLALQCEIAIHCGPSWGTISFCHPEYHQTLEWLTIRRDDPAIAFDADAARRCLQAFEAAVDTCESVDCDPVYSGTADSGELCQSTESCQSGLRCVGASENVCGGRCMPQLEPGEACEWSSDCASGRCLEGRCVVPVPDGGACTDTNECEPGLACMEPGVCRALVEGDPCGSYPPCPWGTLCHGGACTTIGPGVVPEPGGPCATSDECPFPFACREGFCEPLPVIGEACSESFACLLGACSGGVCTAVPEHGDCRFSADCAAGVCGARTCQALGVDGEACVDDDHCAEGFGCLGGICRSMAACD